MMIRTTLALLSMFVVIPVVAADEPGKADFLTLPPGYANERLATDPTKPLPAATPGELKSYSTLHSLGFEWDLGGGDTNHNATCAVAYRRSDETSWHEALPLFRVDYAGWYAKENADRPYNMFAGSIMFLRPSTEYAIRLSLADPDGGATVRELTLHTRPVPDYGQPARTLHVVPRAAGDTASGDGSQDKPFRGIEDAEKSARPGDLFLLHAGKYGDVTFKASGERASDALGAQPKFVVWKGAGDGPAQFDRVFVDSSAAWFEGLTFQRAETGVGFRAGANTVESVVRANTFRDYAYSIVLAKSSRRWYVADNDIIGNAPTGIQGEGVELSQSSDHTVCYNRISKTADGVSYCVRNCDIFANDVFDYSDDGVEPDYGYANNRIWGNHLFGRAGITFQPMYCGPWYIVRNQIIASTNIFKLRVQDRFLAVNNTFIGVDRAGVPHAHGLLSALMRNNLWIPTGGTQFLWTVQVPQETDKRDYIRRNVLFSTLRADWRTDIDYDGFDWTSLEVPKNRSPQTPFFWNGARILNLPSLAEQIGIEKHGRTVDKAKTLASYTPPPYDFQARPTMLLNPGGDAVDVGVPLPNILEEFAGKSPDLGAFEAGVAVPHVGPRNADWRKVHDEWVLKHQR